MRGKQKTINILKQKIIEMRNQLNQPPAYPTFRRVSPSPKPASPSPLKRKPMDYYQKQKIPAMYRCSSFVNSSANSRQIERSVSQQKEQTHSTAKKETQPNTTAEPCSPTPLKTGGRANVRKSPIKNQQLSKAIQEVDSKFYISSQQNSVCSFQKEKSNASSIHRSVSGLDLREKVEKRRTYNIKQANPILDNPEATAAGKKRVREESSSPSKMFYQAHPRSNLNLHIFGEKEIVLERKGKLSKDKNKSSIEMFSEADTFPQRPKFHNKKHYAQYYTDNCPL